MGHSTACSVCFDKDSTKLATFAADGLVHVYDLIAEKWDPIVLAGPHEGIDYSVELLDDSILRVSRTGQIVQQLLSDGNVQHTRFPHSENAWFHSEFCEETGLVFTRNVFGDKTLISKNLNVVRVLDDEMPGGICISPDRSVLVTNQERSVSFWSNLTSDEIQSREFNLTAKPTAHSFCRDGEHVAVGTENGSVYLWNLESGSPVLMPIPNQKVADEPIEEIVADSHWYITRTKKETKLWQPPNANREFGAVLLDIAPRVTHIVSSDDSRRVAIATEDGTIRVWNIDVAGPDKKPLRLSESSTQIRQLILSSDGQWLCSQFIDSSARLWNLRAMHAGQGDLAFTVPRAFWRKACISPDELVVAVEGQSLAKGASKWVRAWRLVDDRLEPIIGFEHDGMDADVNGAATRAAIGKENGMTTVYRFDSEPPVETFQSHTGPVTSVVVSADGKHMATGDAESLKLWNLTGSTVYQVGDALPVKAPDGLNFSGDGRQLIYGDKSGRAYLATIVNHGNSGESIQTIELPSADEGLMEQETRDRNHLVACKWTSGLTRVWQINGETLKLLHETDMEKSELLSIALTANGRWFAQIKNGRLLLTSLEQHFTVALAPEGVEQFHISQTEDWIVLQTQNQVLLRKLTFAEGAVDTPDNFVVLSEDKISRFLGDLAEISRLSESFSASRFVSSPDGRWLVVNATPSQLVELDAASATVLRTLSFEGSSQSATFANNSKWMVSFDALGNGRLWDLCSQLPHRMTVNLKSSVGILQHWTFLGNRWLCSVDPGGTMLMWRFDVDALVRQARRAVGRNLTREEWENLLPEVPYRKVFPDLPIPGNEQKSGGN